MNPKIWARLSILLVIPFLFSAIDLVHRINGSVSEDRFGYSIANLGDINNDGYSDFAVGAPGVAQSKNYKGRVYIFLGGSRFSGKPDYILEGEKPGDRFGSAITSLGDIDNDGYIDYAISADNNGEKGKNGGKVYIFKGITQIKSYSLSDSSKITDIAEYTLLPKRGSEYFGCSIAGGKDINEDNIPDLLIGSNYGGEEYTGIVYIYLGGNFDQPAKIIKGESMGDLFGSNVKIIDDVTGDGISDFFVGAHYASVKGKAGAGKLYLYSGGTIISDKPTLTMNGEFENGWFGYAFEYIPNVYTDVNYIASSPRGGKEGNGDVVFLNIKGEIVHRLLPLSGVFRWGNSLTFIPDINNDEKNEVLIGAPTSTTSAGFQSGIANIFYGGSKFTGRSDVNINGMVPNGEFGSSSTYIPDFFSKGKGIIVIGAPSKGKAGYIEVYR